MGQPTRSLRLDSRCTASGRLIITENAFLYVRLELRLARPPRPSTSMKLKEADGGRDGVSWRASPGRCRVLRRRLLDLRCGFELHDANVISERIAEADIYAVALLDRSLGELDALGEERLIRFSAVVRREPDCETGCALRDELADLPGRWHRPSAVGRASRAEYRVRDAPACEPLASA